LEKRPQLTSIIHEGTEALVFFAFWKKKKKQRRKIEHHKVYDEVWSLRCQTSWKQNTSCKRCRMSRSKAALVL